MRNYICANVHRGARLCDAPKVTAEIVDDAFVVGPFSITRSGRTRDRRAYDSQKAKVAGIEQEIRSGEGELAAVAPGRATSSWTSERAERGAQMTPPATTGSLG